MIVWLASYPRSGNSFLRAALYFLFGQPSYSRYHLSSVESEKGKVPWVIRTACKLDQLAHDEAQNLVKTHHLHEPDGFPAIYIVRDGRDCLASYTRLELLQRNISAAPHSPQFQEILRNLILEKRSEFGRWGENVLTWLRRPHTAVIRFEDLIRSPKATLSAATRKLGLHLRLQDGATMPNFDTLSDLCPRGFSSRNHGKWQDEFGAEINDLFWNDQDNMDAMRLLGIERQPHLELAAASQPEAKPSETPQPVVAVPEESPISLSIETAPTLSRWRRFWNRLRNPNSVGKAA